MTGRQTDRQSMTGRQTEHGRQTNRQSMTGKQAEHDRQEDTDRALSVSRQSRVYDWQTDRRREHDSVVNSGL